ncbi:DUF6572 domain-containing protein [Paraburkholderia ferrariae]|uniref:DUF6572 domain-containing protein n=1 Tax=Paraburkholderia ferrariae TaxID=386056 RepID=UPI0012EC1DA5|nr:DUF6572 domain-containing protein [Paraburkholderia ferrariae]
MSLENVDVVDAVGMESSTNTIVLTILDSWDWQDQMSHLKSLQAKLNAYFGFIESGQIYEAYPDARGKALRIDILGRFPVPDATKEFFDIANATAAQLNLVIRNTTVQPPSK